MKSLKGLLCTVLTLTQISFSFSEPETRKSRLKRTITGNEHQSSDENGIYPSVTIELCQWKTFNESCPAGSVMIIDRAQYGRMRIGRCLDHNYGYQGCSADVHGYVEKRCSGRGSCSLSLPDQHLDHVPRPCPSDLKAYLEVAYHCQRVENPKDKSCSQGHSLTIDNSAGYLSNFITEQSSLGSSKCPWILTAHPGQKFSIRLFDFGTWSAEEDSSNHLSPIKSGLCHIYAQIQEKQTQRSVQSSNTIVCAGDRSDWTYTSETNVVHVEITSHRSSPDSTYFLLQYKVKGCREYEIRPGEKVTESHPDRVRVTCENGPQETSPGVSPGPEEWDLKCVDNIWLNEGLGGQVIPPNCTIAGPAWGFVKFFSDKGFVGANVIIILVTLIAVLVALVILIIGILSIKQRREQNRIGQRTRMTTMPHGKDIEQTYTASGRYKEQYPMLLKAETVDKCRESDYTVTLPRHLPIGSQQRNYVSDNGGLFINSGQSHRHPTAVNQSRPDQCSSCWAAAAAAGISSVSCKADESNNALHLYPCEFHRREQLQQPRQRDFFVEHIYESPKFQRRGLSPDEESQGTVYNELDNSVTDDRWT